MKETRGDRGRCEPLDGELEKVIIISYPLRRMEEKPQKTGVRKRRGPDGDDIFLDVVSGCGRESHDSRCTAGSEEMGGGYGGDHPRCTDIIGK
ncbi:hypothetical protein VNO78_18003 [Psophocarpus tetragonolobus]|uniref:Uncharacterized protein n=1 Tax=Psophocarpus tetragonolobus TaxID=3891 RepID=A0AAN9SP54_PSOTE